MEKSNTDPVARKMSQSDGRQLDRKEPDAADDKLDPVAEKMAQSSGDQQKKSHPKR